MKGFHESEIWFKDEAQTVAFVTLDGVNDTVLNGVSDMEYEIVDGDGCFTVIYEYFGGKLSVHAGERIGIPHQTAYRNSGNMAMLVTAKPPFNPADVVIVKEA